MAQRCWKVVASVAAVCVIALTMSGGSSFAADAKDDDPHFECRWVDAPIKIDGKADEPAWQNAQLIDKFRRAWERDHERAPKTTTKVRLLWDREYIYFFAEMQDTDLYANITEHDGKVWTNDAFEMFFKPAVEKNGYYEFNWNPLNAVHDCFFPRRNTGGWERYRKDGEFNIETAVQLQGTLNNVNDQDTGWTIEGRIPWKGFLRTGGRPNPGEEWRFAPCRVDISVDFEGEELSSAAILKTKASADYHEYEDYAPLKFVGPQTSGAGAKPQAAGAPYGIDKLAPLTTSKVVGSPEPPHPYKVVEAYPKLRVQYPVFIANQPGSDRMWTATQPFPWGPCQVLRFVDDPGVDRYETIMPFNGIVYSMVFHPDFQNNGYVFFGRNGPWGDPGRKSQIVRYHVDPKPPYALDPKSEKLILEWESAGHDGVAMAFANDGKLFVTSGDGSSDSDKLLTGQDLSRIQAKVLRIDVDHPDPGKTYSVPKDNPFVGVKNARPETWAYGMRNPWRMSYDAKTGNLFVGQNGQDQWEVVYLIERGANYGWSAVEGTHPFYPQREKGPAPISKPIAEHPHAEARSVTGGFVYRGKGFPDLVGAYLYGDYSTGKIWALRVDDDHKVTSNVEIVDSTAQPTCFALDSKGELIISDSGGHKFIRLERVDTTTPRPEFPKTISASGLFKDVKHHVMADGIIPYSVNAELWSDGAYKERFIAIPEKATMNPKPGEDRRIGYTNWRGWEFPNETVLVKSFALEQEAGNPKSRKWIETRFFTRQDNEWVGYSYQWNDEQTDATLVEAVGRDQTYSVKDAKAEGGVRKVQWHYPSRTECMVCHSRAANFVLGPQTLQMNKNHDYASIGGPVDNQLRVLEHLGMLRVNYATEAMTQLTADSKLDGRDDKAAAAFVAMQSPQRNQREIVASSTLLPTSPADQPKLPNPRDPSVDINARARAYLHANCSICHVESGGGNALMEMEFSKTPAEMNMIDVAPLHDNFNIPDAKLVASGAPDRSVLLHRMSARAIAGQPGQMPPLATNVRDEQAIDLIKQWIAQLPAPANAGKADAKSAGASAR